MQHPYLFLNDVFGLFGLRHFAEKYPWVVYSWLIIIFLVVVSLLVTRSLKMIPKGGQNFFEAAIGGLEKFMIDVMGEHGRPYFPLIGTLFIYIFTMNVWGLIPAQFAPTASPNSAPRNRSRSEIGRGLVNPREAVFSIPPLCASPRSFASVPVSPARRDRAWAYSAEAPGFA